MTAWEIAGFGMFLVPVLWCFGQLLVPLFKTFDRRGWLIFSGVLAWYGVAIFCIGGRT